MAAAGIMPRSRSILGLGAAPAVIFTYAFSLALAVGCLALPVIIFSSGVMRDHKVSAFLLSVFGIVAGPILLWFLIPWRDKSEVAGIPIDMERESRLRAEIEYVAVALNESMPREVYLFAGAGAAVGERGGIAGIGSHRVLLLGLPLVATLPVSEFRGLLAHEFAHFYARDTHTGPWLSAAQRSMLFVQKNLGGEPIKSQLARPIVLCLIVCLPPFMILYFLLMAGLRCYSAELIRQTFILSRQKEFRSDEIACQVAGSQAFIRFLRKLPQCEAAFHEYLQCVVRPLLSGGYQPRIAEDFAAFVSAPQNRRVSAVELERRLRIRSSDPFDSHPPLALRIEHALLLGSIVSECSNQSTLSLFDHLEEWEGKLIRKLVPWIGNIELRPVNWDTAADEIYLPEWRKLIERFDSLLSDKTIASLPELVRNPAPIADMVLHPPGRILNRSEREEQAVSVLACAFGVSLVDHGWKFVARPGTSCIQLGSFRLRPHDLVDFLRFGTMSAGQWQTLCSEKGIGDYPLVQRAPAAPAEAAPA